MEFAFNDWSALARQRADHRRGPFWPEEPRSRPNGAPSRRHQIPYDEATAVRVLSDHGVPFLLFDATGVCHQVSPAAGDLLGDSQATAVVRRQASALAARTLAADRVRTRGGEKPVPLRALAGPWWLRSHVLSTLAARRTVLVLLLPAPTTTAPSRADDWGLTPREAEVARLIADSASAKAIAAALGISVHTARRHTERVFAKLRVQCRAEVVLLLHAARQGPVGAASSGPTTW